MKYINADKLIAEINNRLMSVNLEELGNFGCHRVWAYNDVKDLITSLQQEQPDNEDIDKVAQELYEHLYELKRSNNVPTNLYDKQEIINLWKAGIEYGRNHPKQGQPCKDLDVEMDKFFETMPVLEHENIFEDTFKNIARHFAQWQKEQMMKDAYVESRIVEDGRIELEGNPLPCLNPIILLPYPQFKPDNKVKIIIVKEKEK